MEIFKYISSLTTLKTFNLCKSERIRYDLKYVININVFSEIGMTDWCTEFK